jgi:hypothetical protein
VRNAADLIDLVRNPWIFAPIPELDHIDELSLRRGTIFRCDPETIQFIQPDVGIDWMAALEIIEGA